MTLYLFLFFFGLVPGSYPEFGAREDILLYFKYIFNCLRTTVVFFCYSSLICPFSTWPIRRSRSSWKLKYLPFNCLQLRMCATANSKCFPYEPQRFHIISSIMCCLFLWFPNDLTFSSSGRECTPLRSRKTIEIWK